MKNQYGQDFVVVFGSVAAFLAGEDRSPHDIDIVFGGEISESDAVTSATAHLRELARLERDNLYPTIDFAAIDAASRECDAAHRAYDAVWTQWVDAGAVGGTEMHRKLLALSSVYDMARERFSVLSRPSRRIFVLDRILAADQNQIPVEGHRARAHNGVVTLTVPKGTTGHAIVGTGDVRVKFEEVESLPGIIRVHHEDPDTCVALCLEYLQHVGTGIISGIHREFRFEPWDGREDAAYVRDGITAVRNARRQCTEAEWNAIVVGLWGFGPVLEAMSTSSGLPESFMAAHAGGSCAGGRGVLCLDWPGRRFFYPYLCAEGVSDSISFADLVRLL